MPRPVRLPFDEERFRKLWADGVGVREIGRELGVGHNWASVTAKRLGLPRRAMVRNGLNGNLLRAAYENGLTFDEIATQLRAKVPTLSGSSVRRALLLAGTKMRPGRKRMRVDYTAFLRLFRSGWTRPQIAKHYGIRVNRVSHGIRKLIGAGPRGLPPRVNVPEIKRLRRLGHSLREIAKLVGCKHSTVSHHLSKP